MTGAEHYAEAEKLLGEAVLSGRVHPDYVGDAERQIAAAQVHATLALAAATAAAIGPENEGVANTYDAVGAFL